MVDRPPAPGQLDFGFAQPPPARRPPRRRCPRCGASLLEHRHSLSRPLLAGLAALARAGGGPINLKELGLSRNQWDNFQKLRYFGLVDPAGGHSGVWELTPLGADWLAGAVAVPKVAWTFRGEVRRVEGPHVRADEVDPGYRRSADYAADARPREAS